MLMTVKARYLTKNIVEDLKEKMVFLGGPKQVGDFMVSCDNKPWFSVEVKNNDSSLSKNLFYFKDKLSIPYNYQVVKKCRNERIYKGIRVMPENKFSPHSSDFQ